ncbi:uncharacterized protein LOC129928049 [Biomphalaria glabrata]|uniref:Uncharacterized protein LOC129928049 n=1 Tax=Biomphalaria glabrata TaxID=6526 RepID=A0A9W3B9E2_BIOGL|nr:uncharacterized protein LOC129928049 [Biomphalaria glabrata]
MSKLLRKNVIILFCQLFVFLGVSSLNNVSLKFVRHVPVYSWPRPIAQSMRVTSRLSCAIQCLERYPSSCHGYLYNGTSQLCTPCSGLSPHSQPQFSLGLGDFYFHESCDSYPDFKIHTLVNGTITVSAYAAYFKYPPRNYTQAQVICQSMNAHLFVARSVEKFYLFLSIGDNTLGDWIGLDDLANEGHFVWIDNGEEINPLLKPLLFDIYQPDNANGNEDCVYKRSLTDPHSLTLNDAPCASNISYICENPRC